VEPVTDLRLRSARTTLQYEHSDMGDLREALREAIAVADELLTELRRMRDHTTTVIDTHRPGYQPWPGHGV